MKQKIRTASILLLMILGAGLVLMACGAKNLADSRTVGSDSYGPNVESMTGTDSYQMELQKGEMLAVHFETVDDLNLHIAPGEIYGFIGHNGAGKTTTLKFVAGILQFDTGEIYIDGKSIRTQPLECKRSFAYIPDNPDLYDYMTGIKYLNFIADIFHISAADRQMRIRKYGDLFIWRSLWKGGELFAVLDAIFAETPDSVPFLLCVMLCSRASMNFMTAPSVSLEEKSLWLLQSLPVEPWRTFQAKIRMQLLLTGLPLLLCIGCTAAVYPLHPMQLLMLLLFAGSYTLLMALVGLFFGVKMPTLTWTGEIVPIKQGAPVMITLFCGFGYMVLLFVGFMLLPGWTLGFLGYMSCFVGANLLLSVPIYLWLRKQGVARFSAL